MGCRVCGVGCVVCGVGCRVQGAGYKLRGVGCRVQGARVRCDPHVDVDPARVDADDHGLRAVPLADGLHAGAAVLGPPRRVVRRGVRPGRSSRRRRRGWERRPEVRDCESGLEGRAWPLELRASAKNVETSVDTRRWGWTEPRHGHETLLVGPVSSHVGFESSPRWTWGVNFKADLGLKVEGYGCGLWVESLKFRV